MTNIVFPKLTSSQLIQRLEPPKGRLRMVLDTDTFNEIDDQFAVVYSLLSSNKLQVEAFNAAPFHNELSTGPKDGMEKSYQELQELLRIMKREDIPIYKGSESYMADAETPVESDAARNIVTRALDSDLNDPLYVVAIGAISNVASAILMNPSIIERIVVVWLGGNALHWPHTKEFNLVQDIHASRIIVNSGVPLMMVPCMGVASHLQTTLSEIREFVKPQGEIGEFLYQRFQDCEQDHYARSRVIWDMSVIGWLNNPEWVPAQLVHSPYISDDFRWSHDASRHLIRAADYVNRDAIFKDFFKKIFDI